MDQAETLADDHPGVQRLTPVVAVIGGVRPFREGVEAAVLAAGLGLVEYGSDLLTEDDIAIACCSDESVWRAASLLATKCLVLCVICDLDIATYKRALDLGAAVVHEDVASDTIAACAAALHRREVVLPQMVAQQLSRSAAAPYLLPGTQGLSGLDRRVVELYVGRHTWREIADLLGYSPRTLQRRVQHVKMTIGAATRDELAAKLALRV